MFCLFVNICSKCKSLIQSLFTLPIIFTGSLPRYRTYLEVCSTQFYFSVCLCVSFRVSPSQDEPCINFHWNAENWISNSMGLSPGWHLEFLWLFWLWKFDNDSNSWCGSLVVTNMLILQCHRTFDCVYCTQLWNALTYLFFLSMKSSYVLECEMQLILFVSNH